MPGPRTPGTLTLSIPTNYSHLEKELLLYRGITTEAAF